MPCSMMTVYLVEVEVPNVKWKLKRSQHRFEQYYSSGWKPNTVSVSNQLVWSAFLAFFVDPSGALIFIFFKPRLGCDEPPLFLSWIGEHTETTKIVLDQKQFLYSQIHVLLQTDFPRRLKSTCSDGCALSYLHAPCYMSFHILPLCTLPTVNGIRPECWKSNSRRFGNSTLQRKSMPKSWISVLCFFTILCWMTKSNSCPNLRNRYSQPKICWFYRTVCMSSLAKYMYIYACSFQHSSNITHSNTS